MNGPESERRPSQMRTSRLGLLRLSRPQQTLNKAIMTGPVHQYRTITSMMNSLLWTCTQYLSMNKFAALEPPLNLVLVAGYVSTYFPRLIPYRCTARLPHYCVHGIHELGMSIFQLDSSLSMEGW